MDANEPNIHASNFGCVFTCWIYVRVSILIKLAALLMIKSVYLY